MSSANLGVSAKLASAFEKAQTSKVRWVAASIEDVTFDAVAQGASSGDLAADLSEARKSLGKDGLMVLVCVDEASSPKQWVVVAYVPETCKIRKRMLFASGRADIKVKLGQAFFRGEAFCVDPAELTPETVLRERVGLEELPYTMQELALKEDIAQQARPSEAMGKGMASVEFPVTPALEGKMAEFKAGGVDWIECVVTKDEKIDVVSAVRINDLAASVTARVDAQNPRFYLVKRLGTPRGDRTYLVFSCPESSPVRLRMVYSTCKASILEQGGISFDKLLEIRAPDEIDALFAQNEVEERDVGKIVHQDISKPRPGGRRPPTKS